MTQQHKDIVLHKLEEIYKDDACALVFSNPFEMLISTILSAQSTDKQVNKITQRLFELFPTPAHFARMQPQELEPYIKSCGVYRNKAKNIVHTCRQLLERFDGQVPSTREELVSLPGVGRKTANVVLSNAYGQDTIAVDTHVFRVSNRIGLTTAKDPLQTELQLIDVIPPGKRSAAHFWLIWHGRRICSARNPKCTQCAVRAYCRYIQVDSLER